MTNSFASLTPNLAVPDVAATAKFYADVLGFEITLSVPSGHGLAWARLQRDGAVLMVQQADNLAAEYPELSARPVGGNLTLFLQVEDAAALHAAVEGKAAIVTPPHVTFYGMKEFAIRDCNGYILTFAQRV